MMLMAIKSERVDQDYYDNSGHKVGESRLGFLGGANHYDSKGLKTGYSNPGFFGDWNHYDD